LVSQAIWHAGINKTGSTAIQEFLRQNALLLGQQGVLVPEFRKGSHKYLLARDLPSLFPRDRISRESRRAYVEAAHWQPSDFSTAIISYEGWYLAKERNPFPRWLSGALGGRGVRHRAFIWVRDPVRWAASRLLQDLKKGDFSLSRRSLDLVSAVQSFRQRLNRTKKIELELREYTTASHKGKGIIEEFLSTVGIEKGSQLVTPGVVANPSISPEAGLLIAKYKEGLKQAGNRSLKSSRNELLDFSLRVRSIDAALGPFTLRTNSSFATAICHLNREYWGWFDFQEIPDELAKSESDDGYQTFFEGNTSRPPSELVAEVFLLDLERVERLNEKLRQPPG
jgi:hypothetical protein